MVLYDSITTIKVETQKDELYPRHEQLSLNLSEDFDFIQVLRNE